MVRDEALLRGQLSQALARFDGPGLGQPQAIGCRDYFQVDENSLVVSTDRVMVAGEVVGTIPFKGEIVNTIGLWWLQHMPKVAQVGERTEIDPQALLVSHLRRLPFRLGAWGRLSGALWSAYQAGSSALPVELPSGLVENETLANYLVAPIRCSASCWEFELIGVEQLQIEADFDMGRYQRAVELAGSLFLAGQRVARERGYEIPETYYELGVDPYGRLAPFAGMHTPDCTRYLVMGDSPCTSWFEPDWVLRYLEERGWPGEGPPPMLSDELRLELGQAYLDLARHLTGQSVFHEGPVANRVNYALSLCGLTT